MADEQDKPLDYAALSSGLRAINPAADVSDRDWNQEDLPHEERYRRLLRAQQEAGLHVNNARRHAALYFGEQEPGNFLSDYQAIAQQRAAEERQAEHEWRLGVARYQAAQRPEEPMALTAARGWLGPISAGFGFGQSIRQGQIANRIQSGQASQEDYNELAQREQWDRTRGNYSTGRQVLEGLATVPGIAAEFALTGGATGGIRAAQGAGLLARTGMWGARTAAQTALMPSMWLPAAAQRNLEEGREAYDWHGFPSAVTMGLLQTAILGSVSKRFEAISGTGIKKIAARTLAGTLTGVAEQHLIIDPLASAVSDVLQLPHAHRLETGYGPIGDFFQGKYGEGGRKLALSFATFGAFSFLHGLKDPGKNPMQAGAEALKQLQEAGISAEEAIATMLHMHEQLQAHGPADLEAALREMVPPGSKVEKYGDTISRLMSLGQKPEVAKTPEAQQQVTPASEPSGRPPGAPPSLLDLYNQATTPAASPEAPASTPGPLEALPAAQPPWNSTTAPLAPGAKPAMPSALVEKAPPSPTLETSPSGRNPLLERMLAKAGAKPQAEPSFTMPDTREALAQGVQESLKRRAEVAKAESELEAELSQWMATPGDMPKDIVSRAKEAGLNPRQIRRIERYQNGEVFEAIGKSEGVKRQAIEKDVKNALRRIGDEKSLAEQRMAQEEGARSEAAIATTAEAPEIQGSGINKEEIARLEAHDQATDELMKILGTEHAKGTFTMDEAAAHLKELEDVIGLAAQARMGGAIIEKLIRDRYPEVAEHLEPAEFREFIQLAKEVSDGDRVNRKSGAGLTAPLHALLGERLQKEAAHGQADVAGEGAGRSEAGQPQGVGPAEATGAEPAATAGAARPAAPGEANPNELRPESESFLARTARRLLTEESGHLDPKELWENVKKFVSHIHTNMKEFAGEMFPRTSAMHEETGDRLARLVAVKQFARDFGARATEKVMWPGATEADRRLVGATLVELRLRYIEKWFGQEAARLFAAGDTAGSADMSNKERDVGTLVGQPNSPFATHADLVKALSDPRINFAVDRYRTEMEPSLDRWFREAVGIGPNDPKNVGTQIPGLTINLLNADPNKPTPGTVSVSARGDPRAFKTGNAGFTKQATGTGTYETDLAAMIEHSVGTHAGYAAKQEAYRVAEAAGVGKWVKPGERPEGYTIIKDVNPATDTQAAQAGEKNFAVKNNAYGDFRRSFAVDEPTNLPIVKGVADVLTKATLMSTVEAVYHSKNLFTMLFNPGMSLVNLIKNGYKLWAKDPAMTDRLIELSRIGVSLPQTMETMGKEKSLWNSNLNPLTVMGKGLHFLRRAMVLTADEAFTKLASGNAKILGLFPVGDMGIKNTEANRRNFINQLGQYARDAQPKLVQLLRDTGIGPFATATTNFMAQGLRSGYTMNPGLQTKTFGGQVAVRAWKFAKIASTLGVVGAINYALWKRVDGDDNTPFGSVKVGDKNGKTRYFDLLGLTGATRGWRETGLLAMIEGKRAHAPAAAIKTKAFEDAVMSAEHLAGPLPQFVHTLVTGRNSMGIMLAPRDEKAPHIHTAVANANPLYGNLSGANRAAGSRPLTLEEKLWQMFGPYGIRSRSSPPGKPHR
jgi:hypothetical protein